MENNENNKKKSNTALIVVLSIIGGLIVIGVGIYFLLYMFVFKTINTVGNAIGESSDVINKVIDNIDEHKDEIEEGINKIEEGIDTITDALDEDLKTVGDDDYGYVTVPKKWGKFYDIDGTTALQYSYASVYIVSLNVIDNGYSAKENASAYMYDKQNNDEVTGVTGATVQIGKNSEYTAYQVYMYYPSDNTYLITYWFETEDGKVRYLALEGPGELSGVKLTDYLYIPESFSLTK